MYLKKYSFEINKSWWLHGVPTVLAITYWRGFQVVKELLLLFLTHAPNGAAGETKEVTVGNDFILEGTANLWNKGVVDLPTINRQGAIMWSTS